MAQCETILETGERCSNQAQPGTRFCRAHGRITFRKLQAEKAADSAPPPVQPPVPPAVVDNPAESEPAWQAVPSPAGQRPHFPGLRPDGRNILVAGEGIIWLADEGDAEKRVTLFTRLVRLLGFLSQVTPLQAPGERPQVRLWRQRGGEDLLVGLQPHQSEAADLSTFYDAAATATRLAGGRLYIGEKGAFVQYRDDSAPRGYDVPDFQEHPSSAAWLLIARWGSRRLATADFHEIGLADFALAVPPVPAASGPLPAHVYALAARPLYQVLARYFRAHSLHYRLAHLQVGSNSGSEDEVVLFEIQPNPEVSGDAVVPAFVLAYLARLPQVALLEQVNETPLILRQWRRRYPLHLSHISGAFSDDELIILSDEPYASRRVQPLPELVDGDLLTDVYVGRRPARRLTPTVRQTDAALRLPVLLRPDHGPTAATAALLLTPKETEWLRPLLYRLPGGQFANYQICQGLEASLLVSIDGPVEGIPFGQPLRRFADTELFLPLRSRFVPALPWPLLRQALRVRDGVYTFLTETYRLDVPTAAFKPLSRAVLAQQRGAPFRLRPLAELPALQWQPRERLAASPQVERRAAEEPAQKGEAASWLERLARLTKPQPVTPAKQRSAEIKGADDWPPTDWPAEVLEEEQDLTEYLQEQARAYEEAGEVLLAGVCYDLLGDTANSGRCYRKMGAAGAA